MMDSLSKDLLDHIVERLDTIHSRLERQNQEQAVLSGKLSGVSNQLEEEKVFMRDQLQDAQNEILRRLTELQTKGEEPRNMHGSTLQRVELRENTNYEAKGPQEHVPGAFSDEIADKVERSVQDMIRKEFERLNKHFKDSLDETQQNLGREVSRSTEIATKQLHESIVDFTETTKVRLFAQTAGMDDKLDHIDATNEDLRRKMSTCEEKLATVERMTQQHVKDGILTAVNELKNSFVANIKPIFTKKTLICLLLFFAVVLAVLYRSEGFTFMKSQAQHWMGNTKSELDYLSRNDSDSNDDPQKNWNKEFINRLEDIKNQFVSITEAGTQQILDELRNTGDTSYKTKSKKHDVEDIKAELVSMIKEVKQDVKNHWPFFSDIFGGTPGTTKLQQNISQDTLNSSIEVVRSAEMMKVMLQSLDREAEHMMKLLNVTTNSTSQQEGATFNETTDNAILYIFYYVTSVILDLYLVKSIPYAIILLLYVAALFSWSMSERTKSDIISATVKTKCEIICATDKTKSEIIAATDKIKRNIISFIEKENQLVRDGIIIDSRSALTKYYSPSRCTFKLQFRGTYTCDFYVENFQQLVRSGREVTSLPWHINHFGTSVSGCVNFQYNGELRVRLMQGRNPLEVGLEPKVYGPLTFKATITDTSGGLPDRVVGEGTLELDEKVRQTTGNWRVDAGIVSCDELIKKGYGEKEGYHYGALLIRYEITTVV